MTARRGGGVPMADRRRDRAERERWRRRLAWERRCWREGLSLVAGVDEVGRGPLAGPVVAAAVILPRHLFLPGLDDSKRLDPARRSALARQIRRFAIAFAVEAVWPDEIDRTDILKATHKAMRLALERLPVTPQRALVDGLPVPGLPCPHEAIVGGDRLSNSIAAASILAKVARDRLMMRYDRLYPGYGFARNKGYPTAEHRQALQWLGPCPIHRRSFAGVLPGLDAGRACEPEGGRGAR